MSIIVYPDALIRPRPRRPRPDGPTSVRQALLLGVYYLLIVWAIAVPVAALASAYRVTLFDEYRAGYAAGIDAAAGTTSCSAAAHSYFAVGTLGPEGRLVVGPEGSADDELAAFWAGCDAALYGDRNDPWSLRRVLDDD